LDQQVRKVLLALLDQLAHKEQELQFLVLMHLWLNYKQLTQLALPVKGI
jgi:hypothetical protein